MASRPPTTPPMIVPRTGFAIAVSFALKVELISPSPLHIPVTGSKVLKYGLPLGETE
jgi:hypothetical protein